MSDFALQTVVLGYMVAGIILADLFNRFLLWQQFSPFHREIARRVRENPYVLTVYYFGWLFLWPLFLVCLLPFFFLLIRALLREWWYGPSTPFIIEKPVVTPPKPGWPPRCVCWRRDPAVWDALNSRDLHEVMLIECRHCNGQSYYNGGEHAHCYHCSKDLMADLKCHEVLGFLTVAQAIDEEIKKNGKKGV